MKEALLWKLISLSLSMVPKDMRPAVKGLVNGLFRDGLKAMQDGNFTREEAYKMTDAWYDLFGPEINKALNK